MHTYYFEKLEFWQLAMALSKETYRISKDFPKEELFGITSQIRRSAVSISLNLSEGSGRSSAKEQARFSEIAYASLLEVLNLYILCARNSVIFPRKPYCDLRSKVEELSNKINALKKSQLKRSKES